MSVEAYRIMVEAEREYLLANGWICTADPFGAEAWVSRDKYGNVRLLTQGHAVNVQKQMDRRRFGTGRP